MQATKIKDRTQLVAVQKLRTQLTEKDQSKRPAKKNVLRRLVSLLTTQGAGIVMNGSVQKCLHCGSTGQEKVPTCCKHCKPFGRSCRVGVAALAGRAGRVQKEQRA